MPIKLSRPMAYKHYSHKISMSKTHEGAMKVIALANRCLNLTNGDLSELNDLAIKKPFKGIKQTC
jgi:hypothetical protein